MLYHFYGSHVSWAEAIVCSKVSCNFFTAESQLSVWGLTILWEIDPLNTRSTHRLFLTNRI